MLFFALDNHCITITGVPGTKGRCRPEIPDGVDLEGSAVLPGNCPRGYCTDRIKIGVDLDIDSNRRKRPCKCHAYQLPSITLRFILLLQRLPQFSLKEILRQSPLPRQCRSLVHSSAHLYRLRLELSCNDHCGIQAPPVGIP